MLGVGYIPTNAKLSKKQNHISTPLVAKDGNWDTVVIKVKLMQIDVPENPRKLAVFFGIACVQLLWMQSVHCGVYCWALGILVEHMLVDNA